MWSELFGLVGVAVSRAEIYAKIASAGLHLDQARSSTHIDALPRRTGSHGHAFLHAFALDL